MAVNFRCSACYEIRWSNVSLTVFAIFVPYNIPLKQVSVTSGDVIGPEGLKSVPEVPKILVQVHPGEEVNRELIWVHETPNPTFCFVVQLQSDIKQDPRIMT